MDAKYFVPFETAKALKEKGYNEKISYAYNKGRRIVRAGVIDCNNTDWDNLCKVQSSYPPRLDYISAPTYHEVVDWLEREKEIYITTYRVVMAYVVETPQGTIKEKLGWKGCAEVPSGAEEDTDTFITREEALNAGILKALEMV